MKSRTGELAMFEQSFWKKLYQEKSTDKVSKSAIMHMERIGSVLISTTKKKSW